MKINIYCYLLCKNPSYILCMYYIFIFIIDSLISPTTDTFYLINIKITVTPDWINLYILFHRKFI